jgi:hypothetical protein
VSAHCGQQTRTHTHNSPNAEAYRAPVLAAPTVQSVRSRTRAGRNLIGEPGPSRAPEYYAVRTVPSQARLGNLVAVAQQLWHTALFG